MANMLDDVYEKFCDELSKSDAVTEATIEELRTLLTSGKRLRADDFVSILEKTVDERRDDSD